MNVSRRHRRSFDAQMHCVHVVDEAFQYWTAMGPESVPVGVAVEDLAALAEGHMQQFADEHLVGLKYAPITKVLVGRPRYGTPPGTRP